LLGEVPVRSGVACAILVLHMEPKTTCIWLVEVNISAIDVSHESVQSIRKCAWMAVFLIFLLKRAMLLWKPGFPLAGNEQSGQHRLGIVTFTTLITCSFDWVWERMYDTHFAFQHHRSRSGHNLQRSAGQRRTPSLEDLQLWIIVRQVPWQMSGYNTASWVVLILAVCEGFSIIICGQPLQEGNPCDFRGLCGFHCQVCKNRWKSTRLATVCFTLEPKHWSTAPQAWEHLTNVASTKDGWGMLGWQSEQCQNKSTPYARCFVYEGKSHHAIVYLLLAFIDCNNLVVECCLGCKTSLRPLQS